MPDPTNKPAEELPPSTDPAGHFVGLNSSGQGVLYEVLPIISGRLRGYVGGDTVLPPSVYEGHVLSFSNGAAATFTIPLHATEPWPTNACVHLLREGAGALTVVAASGVTLLTGGMPKLRANGSFATLRKIDENRWVLTGDTSA